VHLRFRAQPRGLRDSLFGQRLARCDLARALGRYRGGLRDGVRVGLRLLAVGQRAVGARGLHHDRLGLRERGGFGLGALARGRLGAPLRFLAHLHLRERLLLGFRARARRGIPHVLLLFAPARLLHRVALRGAAGARRLGRREIGLQQRFGLGVERALGLGTLTRALEGAGLGGGAPLRGFRERRHG
jgi:hypothetical protein